MELPLINELKVSHCPEYVRVGFFKKVYGILFFQLMTTVSISVTSVFVHSIHEFILDNVSPIVLGSSLLSFLSILVNSCIQKWPFDIILLILFTIFESVFVGAIVVVYSKSENPITVVIAFGTTMFIFGSLTTYCHISKKDLTFLEQGLFVGSVSLLFMIFMSLFFTSLFSQLILCTFGFLLFSGYILYDTSQIINKYGPDDAINASLSLYLDIVNIFFYILNCLNISNE